MNVQGNTSKREEKFHTLTLLLFFSKIKVQLSFRNMFHKTGFLFQFVNIQSLVENRKTCLLIFHQIPISVGLKIAWKIDGNVERIIDG